MGFLAATLVLQEQSMEGMERTKKWRGGRAIAKSDKRRERGLFTHPPRVRESIIHLRLADKRAVRKQLMGEGKTPE